MTKICKCGNNYKMHFPEGKFISCKKFEAVSVEEKKSIKKIEKAFEEIRKNPKIIKNIENFLLKNKKGYGK